VVALCVALVVALRTRSVVVTVAATSASYVLLSTLSR
jgi:hypothetical protein